MSGMNTLQTSSQVRIEGTIENNLPIHAKNTARWAIRAAQASEEGSLYNLITARVFTAFMMEGLIDHLGRIMDNDWDAMPLSTPESTNPKSKSRRLTVYEKLKTVRKAIGLANDNAAFQELRDNTLLPLFDFRDKFAHPKQENASFEDIVGSADRYRPSADWERSLTVEAVSAEFDLLEKYCRELLAQTATKLESDGKNWSEFYRKYPHLGGDVRHILVRLRTFWNSLGSSTYSASNVEDLTSQSHDVPN